MLNTLSFFNHNSSPCEYLDYVITRFGKGGNCKTCQTSWKVMRELFSKCIKESSKTVKNSKLNKLEKKLFNFDQTIEPKTDWKVQNC